MKILYIIESLGAGGKERRLISLIKELVIKKNIEIEIIILSEDIHYKEIYDFNIKVHSFKRNIKKDIKILSKFNKVLKEFKPNLVHCWDDISALQFAPICKFKKIPFLNSMISTAPPRKLLKIFSKRFMYNYLSYPFSDVILANCKAGLDSFRVPISKRKCIYNGFDFSRATVKLSENEVRKKFNVTTKYVVGMSGGFNPRKDYKTFVEAGQLVLRNRKDVTFLAIGDGPNLNTIKNSIDKKYCDHFKFVGRQHDVESIVNIFNIGVLSTNMDCHGEGISNSIMEYMAFKKPVVATNGGGTPELILNNETGFLVKPKKADDMAEKIEYLLKKPKTAIQMGIMGNERIKTHFTIDRMINEFYDLYKKCIV
ncbi:glycosyltransferase [Aureibaculum conchae]|uniref:glycosyltransferase n=1 Tax=Aureibaculum sp. 2308TA14-22 TaxID=3108392 RepID=UPI003395E699